MPELLPGVELKELVTHGDERGFFREVIRESDPFFDRFGHDLLTVAWREVGYFTHEGSVGAEQLAGACVALHELSSVSTCNEAELPLALQASVSPFFACAKKGNRKKHTPVVRSPGLRQLLLRCSTSGIHAVARPPSSRVRYGVC